MPVRTMRFLFVAVNHAVGVCELRHDLKMLRINAVLVLAGMMQKLIGCQRHSKSKFAGNAMGTSVLPIDMKAAFSVTATVPG